MKQYSFLKACALAGLIIAGTGTQAQEVAQQKNFDERTVRGVIGIGYALGGDKIVNVKFDKGPDDSIKAGQGFSLYGGVLIRPKTLPVEFQATAGFLNDTINAENGKVELERNVLDLGAFYRINNNHRIGLGTTKHSSIKFSGRKDGYGSVRIDYEDANGVFIEWGYLPMPKVTASIRLTKQEYKSKPDSYEGKLNYSANSIGAFASYNF